MGDPNWPDFVLGLRAERDARHPAARGVVSELAEAVVQFVERPSAEGRAFIVDRAKRVREAEGDAD